MSSNNEKITYRHRVDYKGVLYPAWKIPDLSTEQIIDNACLLISKLIQTPNFNTQIWWDLNLCMSEIEKRTDVELEDLDKLSGCIKDLKSSPCNLSSDYIKYLDQFIEDKRVAVSKERFECIEDYYGDSDSNSTNANNTKVSTHNQSTIESNEINHLSHLEAQAGSFSKESNLVNSELAQKLWQALKVRARNLNDELDEGFATDNELDEDYTDNKKLSSEDQLCLEVIDEDFADDELDDDVNTIVLAEEQNNNYYPLAQKLEQALKVRAQNLNEELILEIIDDDFDGYESDEDYAVQESYNTSHGTNTLTDRYISTSAGKYSAEESQLNKKLSSRYKAIHGEDEDNECTTMTSDVEREASNEVDHLHEKENRYTIDLLKDDNSAPPLSNNELQIHELDQDIDNNEINYLSSSATEVDDSSTIDHGILGYAPYFFS